MAISFIPFSNTPSLLTLKDYEICQAPAVFPLLLYPVMYVSTQGLSRDSLPTRS